MARYKMNWDWIGDPRSGGVRCVVYSKFLAPGVYEVKIMIGEENNSPIDKPRWKGTTSRCKSHIDAFNAAFKYAKLKLKSEVANNAAIPAT